jgi:type II secretory pathway pseudopilin PulG
VSPKLRAKVTQLSIVSGTEQAEAGDTGRAETSSLLPPGTGKGNLYLLVQVSGEPVGKEEIHRELIRRMAEEYSRVPGGVTNGLRQALRAANDFLYARNMDSLPLWQRVGETCLAVLRGNDLYMGVAGEARVYVLHHGELHLFPPAATYAFDDALPPELQSLPPLGVDDFLTEVGLFHCLVEEGDLILLASGGLPHLATEGRVAAAAWEGARELVDTLRSLASHSDLSALVIEVEVASAESVPQPKRPPAEARSVRARPAPPRVSPARQPAAGPAAKGIAAGLAALLLALGARVLSFFASLARGVQVFFSWLFSSGLLGRIGRGMRAGVVGLLQGLGTLTRRMLPESEQATAAMEVPQVRPLRRVSEREKSSRLPLVIALAIVAIVAAVSVGVVMRTHTRNTEFSQFVQQARSEMEAAQTNESPAGTRSSLTLAAGYVEEALLLKPGDTEATTLQGEILLALDEVNRVVRLEFSGQVPFADPSAQPRRVLLHDSEMYVLDQGTRELRSYRLDEAGSFVDAPEGRLLLGPDSQLGSLTVEKLTDLAWIEEGSGRETATLVVLVNDVSLLQLDESLAFHPVSVTDSEVWGDARLIDGYFGYLYVLDAREDRILKYAPTGDSYDTFPVSYFQGETTVDLSGAIDMAIDGYIYVLTDKSILKFSGGLEEPFSLSGLEGQELQEPVAMFTSSDAQHIYVADAGAGSIVQFTKEGAFVRQFRPPREEEGFFQSLHDIYVDEAQGRLIALTSNGLFVAPIQQPPSVLR